MNMRIVFGIILLALLGFLGYTVLMQDQKEEVSVASFEECVRAGYPIQESYPERCVTPDGRSFVNERAPDPSEEILHPEHELIRVTSPRAGSVITSPLVISGEARGYWFFEASFPYVLADSNGNVLAQGPISATGEWMTENFVPFTATITFSAPQTATGTLTLMKDNPSDDRELDDEIVIPVSFE